MDPSLQHFSFHKVNKKLQVRIGSLQEELKLVVKIDKGLVHLPGQVRKYCRHKKTKQKNLERKKRHPCDTFQTDRFQQPHRRLHHYNTYSLITKPVDSTLLVNLATYANLPVKRTPKVKHPGLQIHKPNRVPVLQVVRQEGESPFGKEESLYNFFQKRKTSQQIFKLEKSTRGEQNSLNIWQEEERSEFKDYKSSCSASVAKMECGINKSKVDESESLCAESRDQYEAQLRNEANSTRNNNEIKVGNDTYDIKSLPNGEREMKLDSEEFKLSTALEYASEDTQRSLKIEGNKQFSHQVTTPCDGGVNNGHFDQTVPQSIHTEHNHCNGSSSTETGDSIVHDEFHFMDHHVGLVQEKKVSEKLQSLEETDNRSDGEIVKDQQADGMPTLEPEQLDSDIVSNISGQNGFVKDSSFTLDKGETDTSDETKSFLSSDKSIGEKVDEEIKALLRDDASVRGCDASSSEDSAGSSNIPLLEHVYRNNEAVGDTQFVCDMEKAEKKQREIELVNKSSIHAQEDDNNKGNDKHNVSMDCETRERHVNVKVEDEKVEVKSEKIARMWQEQQGENQRDPSMLVSLKEETPACTQAQESGFNEGSQSFDCRAVEYDDDKHVRDCDETSASTTEFSKDEKVSVIDRGHVSSTANISENSHENIPCVTLAGGGSMNKSQDKIHQTGKDPVDQTVENSESSPVSESTAQNSHCPPENLEDCKVGRKGLKQLQSLSQHEAEVTSEQEDIISPTPGSSSGNEKSSTGQVPENCASEARSQSVIVSNPISLSHHINIHGNIKCEQTDSNPGVSDVEVKRETENNSLEGNERGLDTGVSSHGLGHNPTEEAHPMEESSVPMDRSELFQALTPPPPSYKTKRSLTRQFSAPVSNKSSATVPQQDEDTGIQITSVTTLAPLTNRDKLKPSSLSTAVENLKARHAALLHRGNMSKDMKEPLHTIVNEKRTLNHNVILQGPPVASLQATENVMNFHRSNKLPQMHSPNLVDLPKGGGVQHVVAMENDDRERLVMIAKGTDVRNLSTVQGYSTMVPNKNQVLSYPHPIKEVDRPPVPLPEYNPEEQQQHFLEIKRHLLNSNMAGRTKDVAPRVVPMAVSGPNTRPIISVAPVTQIENRTITVDEEKVDSPLGKFSGAMMEHVRHWKEQNEKTNQPQPLLSPVKVIQNCGPGSQPVLYSPVIPSAHPSPTNAVDQTNQLTKDDKTVETQAAETNPGLLENLQAIHKMYFKTMQGGDKVVFPKMPSKKPAPPGPVPDMVQVVKPFMPPMQPHLIPRFPPNGQVPPELLHYQMNLMGRNLPAPSQISPSGQDFRPGLIPRVPMGSASERPQFKFHDMNARFPRPFPMVQMEQVKQNQAGKPEMVMIPPTHPNQFPLPPQAYIGVKQNNLPPIRHEIVSPTSSQEMPILVSPSGANFIPAIDMSSHQKEMLANALKRKSDDGAPLDLSTGAAKVRRIQEDNDQAADQPIDLSTKTKTPVEKLQDKKDSTLVQELHVKERLQPPSVGVVSYHGHLAPQSVNTATKNGSPAKTLPEHLTLSQYHAPQFVSGSIPITPTSIPQSMQLPMMNYPNAQMVLPHMTLPPNSQQSQPPHVDGNSHQLTQQLASAGMLAQKRMPTPAQVEIMKLVAGNTGQLLPHGILPLNKSTTVSPASSFSASVLSCTAANSMPQRETLVQQMSEGHVEVPVKRKRGRPKGSGNKNRRAALIANQLIIQEPSEPVPASASSDIAECQFCDFKAASRGDVRQHVKVVHFAKFRRDSNKSLSGCEILTPTSEYPASVGQPVDSLNVESNTGQWTTVSEQNAARQDQHGSAQPLQNDTNASPFTPSSDSDGSALVIDVSTAPPGAISVKQEDNLHEDANSQGEASQMISDDNQAVNLQSNQVAKTQNDEDRQDKPPLKITLRRISSSSGMTGDRNPVVFSPLPQDRATAEKKAKFICQKCGASYNYVNGLREHESRHRVDLPFECDVCHLKYKTLGMLSRHQAQKNHLTGQ